MEKINLKELSNERFGDNCPKLESYLSICLCKLINDKDIEKAKKDDEIEVELKLNGREVKLSTFIKYLIEGYDRAVDEKVEEIIEDKMINVTNKVEEMVEQFRADLIQLKEDMFSEETED